MQKKENNNNAERDALLKEAFNVILALDETQLKILLERMGFCNGTNEKFEPKEAV